MTLQRAMDRLARSCVSIAAPGTDPDVVAHVLAWTVRPRRGPDALRRRCRDAGAPPGGRLQLPGSTPGTESEAGGPCSPASRLRRAARPELAVHDAMLAEAVVEAWVELGCVIAMVGDAGYPPRLAEGWPDLDAPSWIVQRGTPFPSSPSVAIVGARRATGYGTAIAAWLAEAAARAGVRVVSGGAVGVDAAAHRAAWELPGGTTVVLGCGHRVPYPRPHARPAGLFDVVVRQGGSLLSELLPDEPPRAGPVRARNRIVAALADVTVVVEGGERSGALLTAGAAADRGRTVLAVPGDVRAPGSAAPHRLLQEGAAPCTGPGDLLDALGVATAGGPDQARHATRDPLEAVRAPVTSLPPRVHRSLAQAWPRPLTIDELAVDSGHPVGALLAALTRSRVAGEVVEDASGVRLQRRPGVPPDP